MVVNDTFVDKIDTIFFVSTPTIKTKMPIEKPIQLCIPKMSKQIPRQKITSIFYKLNIGTIRRLIENPLRADSNYKRVVLVIDWNTTQLAKEIQETLQDPTEHMNIIYDMPWYWQIFANHPQR